MRKLEATIAADVDGVDAYLVYADWLQTQGDPRGELIALQHAQLQKRKPSAHKAELALLGRHIAHFFGAVEPSIEATWHLGFFKSVRVVDNALEVLPQLLALPSARFLRELSFGRTSGTDQVDYEPVAKLLAKLVAKKPLPHLRALHFGNFEGEDWQVNWSDVGKLAPIYKAFPALDRLRIHGNNIELGKLVAPNLRELEIRTERPLDGVVASLSKAQLPKLERLELDFGGWSNHTLPLRPIFDGRFPSLRHLVIEWVNASRDDIDALATGATLGRLETLSIASTALTDRKTKAILDHAERFAHLTSLDLDNNFITPKRQKLLAKLCKNVRFGKNQKHDAMFEWD